LRGDLKAETESKIIAAQDQVLQTSITQQRYSKHKQISNAHCVNNMIIHYITSACPILAKEQYIKQHGSVCVLNYTLTYVRKQR
jgi:hypothetical protein